MTDHLTPLQIKQLSVSVLPEDDLAGAALHIADCQSCSRQFVEALRDQRGSVPFTFTLEPEFWFRHDHVDFDLLLGLAEETIDQETQEIINIHLASCERCREDVRSFLAFREATSNETSISHTPFSHEPESDIPAAVWWPSQAKPVYVVAAIVLLAVAVLFGVVALNRISGRLEANNHDSINPHSDQSPTISPSPEPSVIPGPTTAKVAVLNDAAGKVTIDSHGLVTGLDEIPESNRHYIAQVVLAEQLEPPKLLSHLAGGQTGLRGHDDGAPSFRLSYPIGRVVTEDRPVFRWESLRGASTYRVYVLDANGNQVSQSEELPATETRWKVPTPLQRGRIFSWVVTGLVGGKKIVSPSATAPEAKFAVLSAIDFHALNRIKTTNSHLALGVFYARAGLLEQAEREFQTLRQLNPDSELPRKLLQSLQQIRHGR